MRIATGSTDQLLVEVLLTALKAAGYLKPVPVYINLDTPVEGKCVVTVSGFNFNKEPNQQPMLTLDANTKAVPQANSTVRTGEESIAAKFLSTEVDKWLLPGTTTDLANKNIAVDILAFEIRIGDRRVYPPAT